VTADEALAIVARRYFSPHELAGDIASTLEMARRQARGYAGWVEGEQLRYETRGGKVSIWTGEIWSSEPVLAVTVDKLLRLALGDAAPATETVAQQGQLL
jgi:hypothetical protein